MAADSNAPAASAGNNNELHNNTPVLNSILNSIFRGVMMYMVLTTIKTFQSPPTQPQQQQQQAKNHDSGLVMNTPKTQQQDPGSPPTTKKMTPRGALDLTYPGMKVEDPSMSKRPKCIWQFGSVLDLDLYITDQSVYPIHQCMTNTKSERQTNNDVLAEWHESNIVFVSDAKTISIPNADGGLLTIENNNQRSANLTVPITEKVQFNETHLYAHLCLTRKWPMNPYNHKGSSKKKKDERNYGQETFLKTIQLTKLKKRKRKRNEKSLLDSSDDEDKEEHKNEIQSPIQIKENSSPLTIASANTTEDAMLLYLKPTLTLQMVDMKSLPPFPEKRSIPKSVLDHIDWYNDTSIHYPIIYSSEFWIVKSSLVELNDTIQSSNIEVKFEDISFWKWSLMSQMEETWRKQAEFSGEEDDAGNDMLRTMLLETNPILLAVTAIVSVLHTVFDVLAFKNDIHFFKGKKSMEGLSLRSMVINTIFQVVILLYLMDNETSFMILVSNGVGVAIEMWKISKAVKLSLFDESGKLALEWKETETYSKSKTKEYDEVATDHLMFVTMPLVTGYGVYSLFHQKHKGWYSWILNTLVGFIYMFGFVMMTPQVRF